MLEAYAAPTPTDEQMSYGLATGMRFTLGFIDDFPRQTVAVVSINGDWIEYDLEDRQGNVIEPRKTMTVRVSVFRASILAALTPHTKAVQEQRGYI